jgi:hypothetical protein
MISVYDDGLVACAGDELIVRRYYFPFATAKHIPLSAIRGVRRMPLRLASGSWRIWGSGDLVHYFNLDAARPRKRVGLIVDLGRRIKPVVTPNDPQGLIDEFRAHGIDVADS